MSQTAKRLAELGVVLPKAAAPVANYVPFVRTSGMAPGPLPLLFVSGQLPLGPDGKLDERHKGKLGPDSPIDAAREAAERCAINILAQAHEALGEQPCARVVITTVDDLDRRPPPALDAPGRNDQAPERQDLEGGTR